MTGAGEEAMRRDREGLAFMVAGRFVRYGLTGVCHEAGNLRGAAAGARRSGALRCIGVSYEAEGMQLVGHVGNWRHVDRFGR